MPKPTAPTIVPGGGVSIWFADNPFKGAGADHCTAIGAARKEAAQQASKSQRIARRQRDSSIGLRLIAALRGGPEVGFDFRAERLGIGRLARVKLAPEAHADLDGQHGHAV